MKRLTYISGFVFTLSATSGFFSKLFYWPGADAFFMTGLFGLAFIFMPVLLINRFKSQVREVLSERMKWVFGWISLVLFSLGGLFKVLHCQEQICFSS